MQSGLRESKTIRYCIQCVYRNESNRLAKSVHTGGRAGGAARKEVTIQTHGLDKYKRTIGDVLLSDGTHVNHMLVKSGWCWWYRKYAPGDAVHEELEKAAREERKDLWSDPQSVPPWEWRKRNPS